MRDGPLGIAGRDVRRSGAGFGERRIGIELERAFKRDLGFRSLLREEEGFANPFEEIAIIGELGLHFGERAIALHDVWQRSALHAGVNVSDAEIARSQIGRRLAPGGDAASSGRIGKRFLYAGPGYGGSCFPKDVQALLHLGRAHGVPMRMAEATHLANEEHADFLANLVDHALGGLTGKTVAFWGLAFKPETDDVRESPSIRLATAILNRGGNIVGHDPEASRNFAKAMASHGVRVRVVERDYDALDGAAALVLLTEWRSYRAPNFSEIRRRLSGGAHAREPLVVDARNIWRPADVVRAGLRYQGIGVPSTTRETPPRASAL